MQISVVIPALNAGRWLNVTLKSLFQGKMLPKEILVIDGGSADDTKYIARGWGAKVIPNPLGHAAAARQIGVEACSSEIVAFTDADCRVDKYWLWRIGAHFKDDDTLAGVGGRVILSHPINEVQKYAAETFATIMRFPEEAMIVRTVEMPGSFVECNCAYKKEAVLAAGGYDFFFSNYAEGIDLFWRMIKQGWRLLFDPAIVVEHLGYPDTMAKLVRTHFKYGVASTKLAKVHIKHRQIDFFLYRRCLSIIATFFGRPSKVDTIQILQILAFTLGKMVSSLKYRIINL